LILTDEKEKNDFEEFDEMKSEKINDSILSEN
jgi:hypothetical protein